VLIGGLAIGSAKVEPEDGKGALLAWDPVAQRPAWKVQHDFIWNGGTLSTGGDLVFQGTADGYLSAYEARSGRKLWRFDAQLGIIAAPISYSAQGRQYVAVLVGYGGAASIGSDTMNVGWKWRAPRRLLAFTLDGSAQLPPSTGRDTRVNPLDDPTIVIRDADVSAGKALYMNCVLCHGRELSSAGAPAPDLRESAIAIDREAFWKVVHDGTLMAQGMPQFEDLTREQVDELYAYIRAGARAALHPITPGFKK
jgi:quinohemoprotein ethanol dehydrogenase